MVIYETAQINGQNFEHVYSDTGRYLVRDGKQWEEVYNPPNTGRTYDEGELISNDDATAEEILNVLLGEEND